MCKCPGYQGAADVTVFISSNNSVILKENFDTENHKNQSTSGSRDHLDSLVLYSSLQLQQLDHRVL